MEDESPTFALKRCMRHFLINLSNKIMKKIIHQKTQRQHATPTHQTTSQDHRSMAFYIWLCIYWYFNLIKGYKSWFWPKLICVVIWNEESTMKSVDFCKDELHVVWFFSKFWKWHSKVSKKSRCGQCWALSLCKIWTRDITY
jgi:hypothetical protein